MNKTALITGVAGQDGSYLAEFLLSKKYEVYGIDFNFQEKTNSNIAKIKEKIHIYECDVTDKEKVSQVIEEILPDEIYHLAGIANPLVSPETESAVLYGNINGLYNILSAARKFSPKAHIFFAGSSLIFGKPAVSPQDENTPINPNTPYGIAKAAGYFLVKLYRESYGIFVCTGILYNHESLRRNPEFLPKKITQTAAKIKKGLVKELRLGDLRAIRDWGYAGDYVEAMWLMLQAKTSDDYVVGTGKGHTVENILEIAFGELGLNWRNYVIIDPSLVRTLEQIPLIANPRKIGDVLGWKAKTEFKDLIVSMVRNDLINL